MAFWHVNREDIDAYLMGMSTYGTGGGGNPETGRALLNAGLDNGRVFNMVDPLSFHVFTSPSCIFTLSSG